jgi:hypothetical protein
MEPGSQRARKEAEAQMRRAGVYWAAFDRAVHRVRYAYVMEYHFRYLERREQRSRNPRIRLLAYLHKAIDATHDIRLSEQSNMAAMAETAKGAEMMARIWYEEADGLLTVIPNPQRWDTDG